MNWGLFWTLKPRPDESVTNIAYHQVEVLENGRCGSEIVIVYLCNRQAEIDQLVVTTVETWQNGIVVVDPTFNIIFYVEVHHT